MAAYTAVGYMTTLTLTDEAVSRLRSVLETQQAPDGALRVFVSPGGCSGFSYGMSLEAGPAVGDDVVQPAGVSEPGRGPWDKAIESKFCRSDGTWISA